MYRIKILLVDDSDDDLFLAKRILSKLQLNDVDIAHNGKEALEYLFGEETFNLFQPILKKPDLILLDQRMPLFDGLQFMECAHNALNSCNIPVIILTSSTLEREKERFSELGAKDYIAKPVNVDDISRAIISFCDGNNLTTL